MAKGQMRSSKEKKKQALVKSAIIAMGIPAPAGVDLSKGNDQQTSVSLIRHNKKINEAK